MELSVALGRLPERVLPVFLDVLRDVHPDLAVPFLQSSLQEALGSKVEEIIIRNARCKLRLSGYVRDDSSYLTMEPSSSLKKWQVLCPDSPTLFVRETRTNCQFCEESELQRVTGVESFSQHMSSRMAWSPASGITRFRVFTLSAGIQLAAFQPSKCTQCQRLYLGGWCF